MKKALILINSYYTPPSVMQQAQRIQAELQLLGITADIKKNDGFWVLIDHSHIVNLVSEYDFCVYLDKDKYVSAMLEKAGLKLFNSHRAIQSCDDKMCTYLLLENSGVCLAKTLPGLLCYDEQEPVKMETVRRIEEELAYPIIVKESYGSLGKAVYKADNRAELLACMERVKCKPHLFQQFIKTSYGKDMRVIVIDGKFCAAILRHSEKDFRSNIDLGAEGARIEPDTRFVEAAISVANLLQLDYCGVDLLFGECGEPVVCEVNSNAFFAATERVSGVNVARQYALHMFRTVYGKLPD